MKLIFYARLFTFWLSIVIAIQSNMGHCIWCENCDCYYCETCRNLMFVYVAIDNIKYKVLMQRFIVNNDHLTIIRDCMCVPSSRVCDIVKLILHKARR